MSATAESQSFGGRTAWARNVAAPVRDFLTTETGGGAVLLAAAIAALVWANSPWRHSYETLWTTRLTISNGRFATCTAGCWPGACTKNTIGKTISIVNDGVGEAGMQLTGNMTAITINAGPNDSVTLRGLTIKGVGSGNRTGILFQNGMSLRVENCVIRNLPLIWNGATMTASGTR